MAKGYSASRQSRMLIWLIVVFNLLIVGLAGHHLYASYQEDLRIARTQTRNIASAVESAISSNLEKSFIALRAVALDYEKASSTGNDDGAGVGRSITEFLTEIPFLESIRVTDATGRVILGVAPGVKASAGDRDYFIVLRDDPNLKFAVSSPVVGRINNRWTIFLATRHNRPDGSFGGVVLAGVPLANFTALFSALDLGADGIVSMRGADLGHVARWPEPAGAGSVVGLKTISPEFKRILDANLAEETYVARTGSDGVERLLSYKRVRAYPFHLVVGISTAQIEKNFREEALALLFFLPFIALVSVVLLVGWFRQEARRVEFGEELAASERRFRVIFNEAKDGIIVADVNSRRFVLANDTICRMLGYSREEMTGLSVPDIHPIDRIDELQRLFEEHAREGTSSAVEVPLRRKDGTVFYAEVTATRTQLGGQDCLIGIFRDISAKLKAEEELESIFRLSLDLLAIADTDGNFRRLNPAWEAALGYPIAELEKARFFDFVHPDDHEATLRATAMLAEGREVIDFTNRYRRSDGTYRWIEWRSAPYQGNLIYAAARDVTDRKEAEAALMESQGRARAIIESSPMGIHLYTLTEDGRLLFLGANPAADAVLGVDNGLFFGKTIEEAFPALVGTEIPERYRQVCLTGEPWRTESVVYDHDSIKGAFEVYAFRTSPGQMAVFFLDVTERIRAARERENLEEELRQAQKMEAVGRLAGGIAHDFNNVLTAILGYCALLLLEKPLSSTARHHLEEIQTASERAASLTRQLLAYSRKQILQPRILNPAEALTDIQKMLGRLLGEDIELTITAAPDTGFISADPSQLGQVLLNLAINARDALPHGGRLAIETSNFEVATQREGARLGLPVGRYVTLTVRDNGTGMDEGTLAHIYEPFFTTKEVGKGTGLGLATVHGIVAQSGGHIKVESNPGEGTIFRLYFPRIEESGGERPDGESRLPEDLPPGSEMVLLAEDSAEVRSLAVNILTHLGYRVLVAQNGEEALALAQREGHIDLLLTDIVMPLVNGTALAEMIASAHPETRVLYMSGYTENTIVFDGVLKEGLNFIQKPFRVSELAKKVREVLDTPHH